MKTVHAAAARYVNGVLTLTTDFEDTTIPPGNDFWWQGWLEKAYRARPHIVAEEGDILIVSTHSVRHGETVLTALKLMTRPPRVTPAQRSKASGYLPGMEPGA